MKTVQPLALIGALFSSTLLSAAQPKIDVVTLAEPGQWIGCNISPRGARAAVLIKKDQRFAVRVDGVEGPTIDQILPFDGRPLSLANPPNTAARIPVVFSDDGLHHAYLANVGDEYIFVKDGKELARGKAGAKLQGLAFSLGGKHVYFVESDPATGSRLVMDGKPEAPLQEPPKLVFSRDGSRYAYAARKRGEPKSTLFVDGQQAPYPGEDPQFTFDSKLLLSIARIAPGDHRFQAEGKPILRARRIFKMFVSPYGKQVLLAVSNEPQVGQHLVMFGKKIPDSDCNSVKNVFFSPDGKRYAAICKSNDYSASLKAVNNREFVIIDGKKGATFHSIREHADTSQDMQRLLWLSGGHSRPGGAINNAPGFTADSSKFIYMGALPPQEFVVVEEEKSEGFPWGRVRDPLIGGDGKRMAAFVVEDSKATIVIDGKRREIIGSAGSLSFSPDGSRFVYQHTALCVDGEDRPLFTLGPPRYLFSPDSKHLLVVGQSTPDPKRGIFIDGKLVLAGVEPVNRPLFTPDSKHFLWLGNSPPAQTQDGDGIALFVDGKQVVRFRELINTKENWEMTANGVLSFVARSGDALKRFSVTPSSDTSLATLIAAASKN